MAVLSARRFGAEVGPHLRSKLKRVGALSDITRIEIGKPGSDGWCHPRFDLLTNGQRVFSRAFDSEPDGCRWVGTGEEAVVAGFDEIRASTDWQTADFPLPVAPLGIDAMEDGQMHRFRPRFSDLAIDSEGLASRISSVIGRAYHGRPLRWHRIEDVSESVRLTPFTSGALMVELGGELDVDSPLIDVVPDPAFVGSFIFIL